jgi:hypothetical protein
LKKRLKIPQNYLKITKKPKIPLKHVFTTKIPPNIAKFPYISTKNRPYFTNIFFKIDSKSSKIDQISSKIDQISSKIDQISSKTPLKHLKKPPNHLKNTQNYLKNLKKHQKTPQNSLKTSVSISTAPIRHLVPPPVPRGLAPKCVNMGGF